MIIHFIRNATFVIESGPNRVLVDPMLGPPGSLPPYSLIRFKARRNPLVPLPASTASHLAGLTAGLVTHTHFGMPCDHLDREGLALLAQAQVPVYAPLADQRHLKKKGLRPVPVVAGKETPFLGGTIRGVPSAHGRGLIGKLMGPGLGYVIRWPGEPSVYLAGDTVLTESVERVLAEDRPDLCIIPCGGARLDIGGPILMPESELLKFIRHAPGRVLAIHMDALNHCPMTRDLLRTSLTSANLLDHVSIPNDGDSIYFASAQ